MVTRIMALMASLASRCGLSGSTATAALASQRENASCSTSFRWIATCIVTATSSSPRYDDLHKQGTGLRILTGKLAGTYSPGGEGKFFFTMMAAFAELERDIIHERTMAGLAAARAKGRTGGRPTVMNADTLAAARARHAKGESPTQIAKALGISRATVYRHLAG